MMIPLIMRTTEELLLLVPSTLREGALALGATRARAVFTVVVPAALPGILTGILLAYAIAPYEDWHRQAWAGALVLVAMVLICSLLARVATARMERLHRG